jgi:hypothetical protein
MYKIAISGKANSGKNTVGDLFKYHLLVRETAARVYAFADPIKEIVMTMFPGAERNSLFGASKLRSNIIPGTTITYRQSLLDIGKLGRSYDPEIWVKKFEQDFYKNTQFDLYMVTDLRFPEEFKRVSEMGFVKVRIKRDDHLVIKDVSETSQDSITDSAFDFVIDNNGTLDDLKAQCLRTCLVLRG